MAEPEEVILDAAHRATALVGALWRRNRAGGEQVQLADVRPRLELLVGAIYGDTPPIVAAEPPARPSFIRRIAHRLPRHLIDTRALSGTDGSRLRLPRALDADGGAEAARGTYRLLALEQAARATRGTATHLAATPDALVRALYLLSEAVAVDEAIARELPGVAPDLSAARLAMPADRPDCARLPPRESRVERLVREVLEAPPGDPPPSVRLARTPDESLEWARVQAERIRQLPGAFRGVRDVALWGRTEPPAHGVPVRAGSSRESLDPLPQTRVRTLVRRPRVRQAPADEDDTTAGMWMIQLDDPQQHAEDPMGLQRPSDRDADLDPDSLADSVSELPEARLVPVPGSPTEVLSSDDPPARGAHLDEMPKATGLAYPEWDWTLGAYHPAAAVVRVLTLPPGDPEWAARVLRDRAGEVRQVRRRFERLRPQRVRVNRQADGPDVDLAAYVTLHADLRAGGAADDRLYEDVRTARRGLAIALLVDVSGSTDSWVSGQRRIIDVEKEALLLVCEALDALGERYAVLGFSGEGPSRVAVYPVKSFSERYGLPVRRRIAGLEPDRYTRFGAALRHATALLSREAARHRLLLVLSDGKPNDVDRYEGRYGVEDTRQAVAEARLQAMHPFCLTVDREAPVYLPRVFGPGGYAVLRDPERLPRVLLDVVRRLLRT